MSSAAIRMPQDRFGVLAYVAARSGALAVNVVAARSLFAEGP